MGSQIVGHDWATELNWAECNSNYTKTQQKKIEQVFLEVMDGWVWNFKKLHQDINREFLWIMGLQVNFFSSPPHDFFIISNEQY